MIESHRLRGAGCCIVAVTALLSTASQPGTYLPLGIAQGNVKFWGDTPVSQGESVADVGGWGANATVAMVALACLACSWLAWPRH